jgi:multimeric flavodoxin WrbA
MKIVSFVGSPRKKGDTTFAVDKILEGAKEKGAEIQSFHSAGMNIKPCQACFACKKGDKGCILTDDMQKIYTALEETNVLVLGSPIYMGQMTAQAKIFTDRLFAQMHPRFSPNFKEQKIKKKLILVFSQGNPDVNLFQTYYDYTKKMFQMLEFDVEGLYVIAGTRTDPASEQKGLDITMKNIGASLVL